MSLFPQVASCAVTSGFNYQELLALEPQDIYNKHFSLVPISYEHKTSLENIPIWLWAAFIKTWVFYLQCDWAKGCKPKPPARSRCGRNKSTNNNNAAAWLLIQYLSADILHSCIADSYLAIQVHLSTTDQVDVVLPRQEQAVKDKWCSIQLLHSRNV